MLKVESPEVNLCPIQKSHLLSSCSNAAPLCKNPQMKQNQTYSD